MHKIKYILSNAAKFHHFETGRALFERNQLSKLICGYPWFKLKNEKIPKKLISNHGYFRILNEIFFRSFAPFANYNFYKNIDDFINIINAKNIDRITKNYIKKSIDADVLLSLSSVGLNAGKEMKKKNKIYVCERSSSHIIFQNNLLKDEYKEHTNKVFKMNNWFIDRDLEEYETADIILAPSKFVKKSFDKFNINKVETIEFGTNLDSFYKNKTIKKSDKFFDILFIGAKSLRKGLHYLIDGFNKFEHPNKRLHVVGSNTEDKDFFYNKLKNESIFVYGHMPHSELNDIINKCHVFVLPSVEDGYGLVALQAAAAGCPVIVSENAGASDFVSKNKCGFIVPARNSNAISNKLQALADEKNLLEELSYKAINSTKVHTWLYYVDKLDEIILKFINNK